MRAVFHESFGGPEVLQVGELPDPVVGPETILVRVRAAGVNPVDVGVREGHLRGVFPTFTPVVPGWDVAGVVEAVGPAEHDVAVGDEVLGYVREDYVRDGCYAELVGATSRHLALKPPGVGFAEAAALPLAGLTALQSLNSVRVGGGDVVLVHAGAGGVGHLAVQIARARGARVLATAGEGNHEFLRSLGAEPLLYGEGLVDAVRELAPDGVDAALDYVGGAAVEQSVAVVKDARRTGSVIDPSVAEAGGVYTFVRPDPHQLAQLVAMVDEGSIRVHVQEALPLERAADAHRLIAEHHVRGKLVLTV